MKIKLKPGKLLRHKIMRRKFTALKYGKGTPMRAKMNKDVLTSEYMPSYKYISYFDVKWSHGGISKMERSFITKKGAIAQMEFYRLYGV